MRFLLHMKYNFIIGMLFLATLLVSLGKTNIVFALSDTSLNETEKQMVMTQWKKVRDVLDIKGVDGQVRMGRIDSGKRGKFLLIHDDALSLEIFETGVISQIISYSVAQELHNWQATSSVIYPPTKNSLQMQELAKSYVKQILGFIPDSNYKIKTRYWDRGYPKGEWHVFWVRTLNGYEYDSIYDGGISVAMSDHTGEFLSFGRKILSVQECPTEVKISQKQAEQIATEKAIRYARKIYHSKTVSNPVIDFSQLKIVNPDHTFDKIEHKQITSESEDGMMCRLAYETQVRVSVIIGETNKETKKKILIYIDAATGEVVGGDWQM